MPFATLELPFSGRRSNGQVSPHANQNTQGAKLIVVIYTYTYTYTYTGISTISIRPAERDKAIALPQFNRDLVLQGQTGQNQ